MDKAPSDKRGIVYRVLTLISVCLIAASFVSPGWWVSLTAPNYPEATFPQGIRILFHMDSVRNGCDIRASQEVEENEALDCVHEMDTINHYVGMYPIETGAPVERPLAKFFFAFFAVMMVAFVIRQKTLQLAILGVGFAAIAAWMVVELYVKGTLDPFIANYMEEAGRFFKEPGRIASWGATLKTVTGVVVAGLIGAMVIVIAGVWKLRNFQLLLALVPALLPVFFVMDYAGWLWFFGHNLHPWGAFTVKPFMPTVFGEGKVAQFSTFSYPHYGYGLLLLIFVTMILALLIRRKQLREQGAGGTT